MPDDVFPLKSGMVLVSKLKPESVTLLVLLLVLGLKTWVSLPV